eukprot:TRINITY_DN151_c0_g1_i1.p1 TRINITY_DN151_c0_g1~~TRINITY_DN151_c0_g1_i1.p1  ORF type:complete len:484 (-),score=45.72 TRINITY_DN151_c0_g1_i1:752-2203(-)
MLLVRSSSTPVLGSLVSPLHHCETLKEIDNEAETRCLSRSSSCNFAFLGVGSSLLSPVGDDGCSMDGGEWDFDTEVVPWPRFRRVQSENDLQSLGPQAAYGKSPARLAADMFLHDGEHLSGVQRQWSRRTSLRRASALTVVPCGGAVGYESETMCAGGIAITMSCKSIYDLKEEETPVNSYARPSFLDGRHGDAAFLPGVQSCEVNFPLPECCADEEGWCPPGALPASSFDPTRNTEWVPALSHGQHIRFHEDDDRPDFTEEMPTVSGRLEECVYKVGGEIYTSTAVSADGSLLLCNGKGCRPLRDGEHAEAMFIAGGLGIGGGAGGGGGGGAWGGISGGGSSGWGGFGTETDAYYQRMLQVHPGNALLLRNYARFLHEVQKDAHRAEEYYERAILANPGDGELLAMYGKVIWENHRDQERAGNYFDRALKVAPEDSYVLAAYASYLWSSDGDDEDSGAPAEVDEKNQHMHSMQPFGSATTAF